MNEGIPKESIWGKSGRYQEAGKNLKLKACMTASYKSTQKKKKIQESRVLQSQKSILPRELVEYKLSVNYLNLEMDRFLTMTGLCLKLSIRNRKARNGFEDNTYLLYK